MERKFQKIFKWWISIWRNYLNGEIWSGKGKEHNLKGIKILEGEYINGKRNGIIKEIINDFDKLLEGNYINEEKNG